MKQRDDDPSAQALSVTEQAVDKQALLQQADSFLSAGKLPQAEEGYRKILAPPLDKLNSPLLYSRALSQLCLLYRSREAYTTIIECCQHTLRHLPGLSDAYYFLGASHQVQGNNDEALQNYRRVLEANPDHTAAHFNTGILLQQENKDAQAIIHFRRVTELKPDHLQAYICLALAAKNLELADTAIKALRSAITLAPDNACIQVDLGTLLKQQNLYGQAIVCHQQALTLDPGNANAHYQLADIFEMTNQLIESEHHLRQSLALEPENPLTRRLAATLLRRQGKINEAIAQLESISGMPESFRIHFELGRLYDRSGDSRQAFRHFQEGNRLLARGRQQGNHYLERVRNLRNTFTEEWLTTWTPPVPTAGLAPIFLIGFPRSGTTLLDQILDSHPRLQVLEERAIIEQLCQSIARSPQGYPQALASLDAQQATQLQQHYLHLASQYLEPTSDGLFIDKLPLNIIHTGLITRVFPNARFILALRHPCDVCLSCFMQAFAPNEAMDNFYTLERTAVLYAEVMELWHHYTSLLPLNYHVIKYENLVENFTDEIHQLLGFLDLEWDERVLEYNHHARERNHINTPSYNQVTEKIYTRAKYRWQRYSHYMQPVMKNLAPLIRFFDY